MMMLDSTKCIHAYLYSELLKLLHSNMQPGINRVIASRFRRDRSRPNFLHGKQFQELFSMYEGLSGTFPPNSDCDSVEIITDFEIEFKSP